MTVNKHSEIIRIAQKHYIGNALYSQSLVEELEEFFEKNSHLMSTIQVHKKRSSILPWKKDFEYTAVVSSGGSVFMFRLGED